MRVVRPRTRVEAPAVTGALGMEEGDTALGVQLPLGAATPEHSGLVQPELPVSPTLVG
jgi:hypothetical protein